MRVIVLSAALAALYLPAGAADDVNSDEIIRKFAAKEAEFQLARNNYTYRQSVKLEEVEGGGKWEMVKAFPDVKIQFVKAFPDLKVQFVNAFPGVP